MLFDTTNWILSLNYALPRQHNPKRWVMLPASHVEYTIPLRVGHAWSICGTIVCVPIAKIWFMKIKVTRTCNLLRLILFLHIASMSIFTHLGNGKDWLLFVS